MANPEDEAHGRLLRELRAPLDQIIGESERLEQEAQQAGQGHFVATLRKIAEAARRANEQIRRLARGLELRNQFIRSTFGRYLGDEFVAGLLERGRPERPLRLFTNLQMRVQGPDGQDLSEDVYAKVAGPPNANEAVLIHFTTLPRVVRRHLEEQAAARRGSG